MGHEAQLDSEEQAEAEALLKSQLSRRDAGGVVMKEELFVHGLGIATSKCHGLNALRTSVKLRDIAVNIANNSTGNATNSYRCAHVAAMYIR